MDTDEASRKITTRQAAVLATTALGRVITIQRLTRVLWELDGGTGKAGPGWRRGLDSGEVDMLIADLRIRSAPWWRKMLVKGKLRAWVDGRADVGGGMVPMLVRLPAGDPPWTTAAAAASVDAPTEVPIVEWPTGAVLGRMVLTDEMRDGVPVYRREMYP